MAPTLRVESRGWIQLQVLVPLDGPRRSTARSYVLARRLRQLDPALDGQRKRLAHGRDERLTCLDVFPSIGGVCLGRIQDPVRACELAVIEYGLATRERGVAQGACRCGTQIEVLELLDHPVGPIDVDSAT